MYCVQLTCAMRMCVHAAKPISDEAEVEALLQRVSDALMPDSRREAMSQLKDLLAENPKVRPGLCCLCEVLLTKGRVQP